MQCPYSAIKSVPICLQVKGIPFLVFDVGGVLEMLDPEVNKETIVYEPTVDALYASLESESSVHSACPHHPMLLGHMDSTSAREPETQRMLVPNGGVRAGLCACRNAASWRFEDGGPHPAGNHWARAVAGLARQFRSRQRAQATAGTRISHHSGLSRHSRAIMCMPLKSCIG